MKYTLQFSMNMRFFSIHRINFVLLVNAAFTLMMLSIIYAATPKKSGTTREVTVDNVDSGGSSAGVMGSSNFVLGSFGSPVGVVTQTGPANGFVVNAGYLGQDLVAPSMVSSIWSIPGRARAITLQWTAPGDNERDDKILSGSRFHISTTTVLTDAQDPGFWAAKRDHPDVVISTYGVNAQSLCSYAITGLIPNLTYYLRIWTMDQATNWSDLSSGGTTYGQPVILSVYVVDPSTCDFGWETPGTSTVAANGVLVRNNGNVLETYSLSLQTGTIIPGDLAWEAGDTPSTNRFTMYSVFNASRPETADFNASEGDDIITLHDIDAGNLNYTIGNVHAVNILPWMIDSLSSDTTMWLRLDTPLSVATTAEQQITIRVTASESQ